MKILYISELDSTSKFGGAVMEKRTLQVLTENFEVQNANVPARNRQKINKMLDLVFSPIPSLYSLKEVKKLKEIIKKTKADLVFFESSKLGVLVKYAKELGKKVLVFFHNCEYRFYEAQGGKAFLKNIYKQERLTLEYANQVFILNERDKADLEELYHKKIENFIYSPVTFTDRVTNEEIAIMQNKEKTNHGLFLGSFCTLNYDGLKWFVDNVLDSINATIDVVGLDFEKCDTLHNAKLNMIGTVDDVSNYLVNADFVISPIFSGSGMKVKTCEALMFGKKIFAANEALIGYSNSTTAYVRCNTKEEYIEGINEYVANTESVYNVKARELYLKEYSTERFKNDLRKAMEKIKL